ncbi:MAG TPA: TetR/AcrR family transcriptional regulator [Polyangiaceae bacterium]|nr:TetR/AcrR family transcriptional regulator [Polyangiaceae bacterium]
MPPKTSSGRPATRRTTGVLGGRSERVVQQVLGATVAELAASGYRAFRMDAVGAAAEVNKTTIYRRWPNKALLVAAAVEWMRRFVHDVPLPDTGSLERDLVEAFRRRMSFGDRVEGQAWARLLAERHDPEVSVAIGGAVEERSAAWYAMVTRAVARGELPDGTDPRLLLGMIGAVVDAWSASSSERLKGGSAREGVLGEELLEAAVRTVIAGARSGSLVLSSARARRVRSVPRTAPDAPPKSRQRRSKRATTDTR